MKFFYQASKSSREICRVVSLSDHDCVRIILPNLREKFKINNDIKCTLREMINGGTYINLIKRLYNIFLKTKDEHPGNH